MTVTRRHGGVNMEKRSDGAYECEVGGQTFIIKRTYQGYELFTLKGWQQRKPHSEFNTLADVGYWLLAQWREYERYQKSK